MSEESDLMSMNMADEPAETLSSDQTVREDSHCETKCDHMINHDESDEPSQNDSNYNLKTNSLPKMQNHEKPPTSPIVTLRRNLSMRSFRRMFRYQKSRNFVGNRESESSPERNNLNSLRLVKSDADKEESLSVSPGLDDVFEFNKNTDEEAKLSSDRKILENRRRNFRHSKTLPSLFVRSQSDSQDSIETKRMKSGNFQQQKLGAFSYTDQNINVSATEKCLDNVYEVLKQGVTLRARRDSSSDLSGPFNQQLSFESDSSKNEVSSGCETSSVNTTKRKTLKHQTSEPTSQNIPSVQIIKRAVSSDDSINRRDVELDLPTGLSPAHSIRRKSRTPSPLFKVDEKLHHVSDNEVKLTRNQIKLKEFKIVLTEGSVYVALYKYEAREKADLSVKAGDLIVVKDKTNPTWWLGEYEGEKGYFPANYVMQVKQNEDVYICTCLTTLQDANNSTISLKKNQIVAVRVDHPVNDPNYLFARCQCGEGLVCKEDLKAL